MPIPRAQCHPVPMNHATAGMLTLASTREAFAISVPNVAQEAAAGHGRELTGTLLPTLRETQRADLAALTARMARRLIWCHAGRPRHTPSSAAWSPSFAFEVKNPGRRHGPCARSGPRRVTKMTASLLIAIAMLIAASLAFGTESVCNTCFLEGATRADVQTLLDQRAAANCLCNASSRTRPLSQALLPESRVSADVIQAVTNRGDVTAESSIGTSVGLGWLLFRRTNGSLGEHDGGQM